MLLSTGSAQKDPPRHNWKIVDWDVKNQIKHKKKQKTQEHWKQEHSKTGTSENRRNLKTGIQESWKIGTSENRNTGKQKHLKTATLENRNLHLKAAPSEKETGECLKTRTSENNNIWKQEHLIGGAYICKQEHWKTGASENGSLWKQEHRNASKHEHLKTENYKTGKQEHLERKKSNSDYKQKPLEQSSPISFHLSVLKELTLVSLAFQFCLIW